MSDPTGLGERGLAIYKNYVSDSTDAARAALALEAARTADRLDELDNIIQGKGVLNLMQFRVLDKEIDHEFESFDITIDVKFAAPLAEARQQAIAFQGMLKVLGLEGSAESEVGKQPPAPASAEDVMAKKRAEREAARAARKAAVQ